MSVVVDYRESASGIPQLLARLHDEVTIGNLRCADYAIPGILGVERKTGLDFAKSVVDARLFRQVSLLRQRYRRPLLLLEKLVPGQGCAGVGWPALRGAVMSVAAIFGVPVIYSAGPAETLELVAIAARQMERLSASNGYSRPGYRPKKRVLYILQGLPGVGTARAGALLATFGSVEGVVAASETALADVPGIGPAVAQSIRKAVSAESAAGLG